MSASDREVGITDRVAERPGADPRKIREIRARHLIIRFVAGAATSIVSGIVTLALGARVGGVFLAFPAILAASLTLIEEQEDSAEAREDARGASIGGVALAVFAAIAAITLGHMSGALALLLATVAWFATALTGYIIAWLG